MIKVRSVVEIREQDQVGLNTAGKIHKKEQALYDLEKAETIEDLKEIIREVIKWKM